MCNKSAFLALLCAVLTSCVDQDYDLAKIKKDSIELTREVTVEVNETTSSTVGSIFGLDNTVISTDQDGNLMIPIENDKHLQTTISKEEIESGAKMSIEGEFCLKASDVPDIIKKSTNTAAPFFIVVDNPSDSDVDLFGEISNIEEKTEFGPINLKPGINKIDMRTCAAAVPYLKNILKDATVSSFSVCGKSATKASFSTKSDEEYVFDLSAYVPMMLDPGFETQTSVSLDALNIADIKEYLSDNQLDASSFTINATIVSEVPIALDATLECTYKDGRKGTVTIEPEIAAGTLGQPVTSTVVIRSNLSSGLADVDDAVVVIKGRVPSEKFTEPVSLNEKQSFQITLNDIEVTIGANYEL